MELPRGHGEKIRWSQLKRWEDYVCMGTFYLAASLPFCQWISGAGWQNPTFSQSCHNASLGCLGHSTPQMKEKPRQTAALDVVRPEIFHKPGRQKIETFCSAAHSRRLPVPYAPTSPCPGTSSVHLYRSALDLRRQKLNGNLTRTKLGPNLRGTKKKTNPPPQVKTLKLGPPLDACWLTPLAANIFYTYRYPVSLLVYANGSVFCVRLNWGYLFY